MDIHRARFIPYPSSAINALSFSASSDSELSKGGLKNLRLAVGRANGDIEIWNPLKGAWAQERTFYAGKDRSIEGLAWTQEPSDFDGSTVSSTGQLRLFSIGYSNAVTEWDLGTGLPLRQSSGNLSEIWCFATQPRMHPSEARKAAAEGKPRGQDIVVGCADGSIALLTTADNDLHFSRFIARPTGKSVRALSIAWRDRYTVAVGFSNSSFKIFDIRGPKNIRTVTLGAGSKGGPKDLHIWALKWLPSGDIVTADSSGEVRFFESKLFSQYQRIKAHNGDIFSIAASQDGNRVFTAGSDMRTSVFQKLGKSRQWGRLGHKFFHGHDVKALAVYDGSKTQNMSFLASGGMLGDSSRPCPQPLTISRP
jgi:U3 small nucleolar RNA-associated protein 4